MSNHMAERKGQRRGRLLAVAATVVAVLAGATGAQAAGNPSIPDGSVTSADLANGAGVQQVDLTGDLYTLLRTPNQNTVSSWAVRDNSLLPQDFSAEAKAALKGEKGDKGEPGESAIVSVMAATNLTNRPDSGLHGNWALDNLTRTVALTRQHAAEASKCGGGATTCWFYTASLVDNGSFTTIDGAKSPQAGATINGTVTGTVSGGTKIEFYASSGEPNPDGVPVNVDGAGHPTSTWVNAFFPDGTVVTTSNLLNWSWTYSAPATCEKWVNAFDGNSGDIRGVNAC
jgi:hypothetical protein